ncbi:hypothetical protein [Rhodoferax koreensis]|uniref:hypothetical protein n=1 Tax=Rhodoferax koreensis TaxID=1842727 RepID=UPI0012FF954E|nr:hypothetical protein [Rhodoferax koreense]
MKHVKNKHCFHYQIATVWHPDADCEVLDTHHGNVRVQVGEPAYQLTTGEIIELR